MPQWVSLAIGLGNWLKRNAENAVVTLLLLVFGLKCQALRWIEICIQIREADLSMKLAQVRTQKAKALLIESKAKQNRERLSRKRLPSLRPTER